MPVGHTPARRRAGLLPGRSAVLSTWPPSVCPTVSPPLPLSHTAPACGVRAQPSDPAPCAVAPSAGRAQGCRQRPPVMQSRLQWAGRCWDTRQLAGMSSSAGLASQQGASPLPADAPSALCLPLASPPLAASLPPAQAVGQVAPSLVSALPAAGLVAWKGPRARLSSHTASPFVPPAAPLTLWSPVGSELRPQSQEEWDSKEGRHSG